MRIKFLVFICSALFAAGVFAQNNVIGKVTEVEGIVTVTDGVTGGTAKVGNPITQGSRYVASSNGSATLKLDNGCTIKLKPSQAVTVREEPCHILLASVQSVGGAAVAASLTGGGGSAAVGAGAVAGLGAGGALLNDVLLNNRPISSN